MLNVIIFSYIDELLKRHWQALPGEAEARLLLGMAREK